MQYLRINTAALNAPLAGTRPRVRVGCAYPFLAEFDEMDAILWAGPKTQLLVFPEEAVASPEIRQP